MYRQALLILLFSLCACSVEARTWKSGEGDFEVDAELVKLDAARAVLKRADGILLTVEISKLSTADQRYIDERRQALTTAQQHVTNVKDHLARRDIPAARAALAAARKETTAPHITAQLTAIENIVERHELFWRGFAIGASNMSDGDRLTVGKRHLICKANDGDVLLLQGAGGHFRFSIADIGRLPNALVHALARRGIDEPREASEASVAVLSLRKQSGGSSDDSRFLNARVSGRTLANLLSQNGSNPRTETGQPSLGPRPGEQPAEPPPALPVPAIEDIRSTVTEIRDLFSDQYAAAKTGLPRRAELVKTLVDQSKNHEKDEPTVFFVMRFEAAALTAEMGDLGGALTIAQPVLGKFQAEGLVTHKANLVKRAAEAIKVTRSAAQARTLVDTAIMLSEEALQNESLTTAADLIDSALVAGRMLREKAVMARINAAKAKVKRIETARRDAEAAETKLADMPMDPAANLKVGVYRCFIRDDWKTGLPHLAQSSGAELVAAAESDLANPTEPEAQRKAGDAWWTLADSTRHKDYRGEIRTRAGYWYEQSVDKLTGLSKTAVEKRLKQLAAGDDGDDNVHRVYLSETRPIGAVGVEIDPGDPPIHREVTINGRKFRKSIWGQPDEYEGAAKVSYFLDKQYETLSGVVGFDPGYYTRLPTSSPVVFRIEGDGKILWISPPLTPNNVASFRIKVGRVQALTLITACGGSSYYARAAWGDPILTKKAGRRN
ncbi:MAG: NPCBM/NEW2 domain-containing protein [Pirellulaceae bacterium]|jgi:hypothetical protein|nr:NPCBM/NEW2 domain-containing protein [Pirellulaceae bacterium]